MGAEVTVSDAIVSAMTGVASRTAGSVGGLS
jgi:hypothetical protein